MIQFLLGMTATIGLVLIFGAGFFVGQKRKPTKVIKEPTDDELEHKRRIKQFDKGFQAMFNYDLTTALKGKDESR